MKIKLNILFFILFTALSLSQTTGELIELADKYALKDFDNEKALETLLQAEKIDKDNIEVLWRISRSYVDIAEHLPDKTDKQKAAQLEKYQLSLEYAERVVGLSPDKSIGYIRRAIANGRLALFKGVFSAISLVNKVRDDSEKAIKLNNGTKEQMAVAYYVLGRTHFKVCEKSYLVRLPLGLGWGDMDKAKSNLKKAIEIRPDYRMFLLELAKVYIEDDENKPAIELLNKIPKTPVQDEDDEMFLNEANELLKKLTKK